MTIQKREFGYLGKDNGDEWWFYLARDTTKPNELFVIYQTCFNNKLSERRIPLAEYLSSGERGQSNLIKLIATLINE